MNQISIVQAFGDHDIMALAAFRYSLGRRTYIVSMCIDWLKQNWHLFGHQTCKKIILEIQEAINGGAAGDVCDVYSWKSFIEEYDG